MENNKLIAYSSKIQKIILLIVWIIVIIIFSLLIILVDEVRLFLIIAAIVTLSISGAVVINILRNKSPKAFEIHDDKIILYTDGVTEAMNCNKQLFGEERLLQTISSSNASPKEIVHLICSEVARFAGLEPQSDDITLLVMEYKQV